MAYNAAAVIEVRVTGDDSNGGGFNTASAGTDYSQSDTPLISVADAVTNGTTTITSASANFPADCVGNFVCVQGGTASIVQRWYQIQTRTNSTTIVVDAAAGLTTGTGATLKLGGAVASPGGGFGAFLVAGNSVFVKYHASPFLVTSSSSGVPGGRIAPVNGVNYCGYDTTRSLFNTDANRPTFKFDPSVTGTNLVSSTSYALISNLILDGNGNTGSIGLSHRGSAWRCRFQNFTAGAALDGAATGISELAYCEITGCSGVIATNYYQGIGCVAWNNTVTPFGFVASARDCISFDNSGATTDGFVNTRKLTNCNGRNNGRHGCNWFTASESQATNCIMEANGGYGFSGNTNWPNLISCVAYSNTSGPQTSCREFGTITLSGSPFVNGAGGDFRLNATAGAGALLRALAFPSAYPNGVGASYRDVGAIQHQDAGGGSTAYVPIRVPRRLYGFDRPRPTIKSVVIPGVSTVTTTVLPVKPAPRRFAVSVTRARKSTLVVAGQNTVSTVFVPVKSAPRRYPVARSIRPARKSFPIAAVAAPSQTVLVVNRKTVR